MSKRPDDGIAVGQFRAVSLGSGHVALLAAGARTWAVVSEPLAAALVPRQGQTIRLAEVMAVPGSMLAKLGRAGIVGAAGAVFEPPPRRPSPMLLVKVTGACNMACTYCYDFHEEYWKGKLDVELVCQTIDAKLRENPSLTVAFHGGEPLLNFEAVKRITAHCDARSQAGQGNVALAIQTNGLLLNEQTIEFLTQHKFDVGVSFDGPRDVHDATRVRHSGEGTFDGLMQKIEQFPAFFKKAVGYLAVVDTSKPERFSQVVDFFQDLGAPTLKLMPVHGGGRSSIGHQDASEEAFVDFLAEMLERAHRESTPPYLMNLIELIDRFLDADESNLCMSRSCGAGREFTVIDARNNIRACDITYDRQFLLNRAGGPAHGAERLRLAKQSIEHDAFVAREAWLGQDAPCASCAWLEFCGGSCPGKALMLAGTLFAIDPLECKTRLRLFPRILEMLIEPDSGLLAYYNARYFARAEHKRLLHS